MQGTAAATVLITDKYLENFSQKLKDNLVKCEAQIKAHSPCMGQVLGHCMMGRVTYKRAFLLLAKVEV